MEVIVWTYEARSYCPDCAWKRFQESQEPNTVDDQGNTLRPVFYWDELPVDGVICHDCGEEIVPPVDAWGDAE